MTSGTIHGISCACCGDFTGRINRRGVMLGAATAGAAFALQPYFALAASGSYEAMVLSCIDPRMQEPVRKYLAARRLTGKYSQFVIAGGAIGVVAEPFKDWQKAFWDNLATSMELHNIKKVIAIDHRDCGAAKIAYGAEAVANPKVETETHRHAMAEFRRQVAQRAPKLGVETSLMALSGKIEMFGEKAAA
jgi:carbonic anhydrase